MMVCKKIFRAATLGCLLVTLLACQNETGQSDMNPLSDLAADQADALQQWMQANGLSAASFQYGSDQHQGAYSILSADGQVVAIKSKGVSSTTALAPLTALKSLELSLLPQTQLNSCPAQLAHLRINGQPTEPLSLGFLQQCPKLTELELFHAAPKNWPDLAGLSELQSLSLRYSDLTTVDLNFHLPQLTRLNLTNNKLQSLTFSAPPERLQALFLSHNQLRVLPDLSALLALESLSLDDNPLMNLATGHLPTSLKTLDLRDTAVLDLAALMDAPNLQRVQIQRRPKSLPDALADKVFAVVGEDSQLAIAEGLMEKYLAGIQFIEKLPKAVNGKALGLHKQSSQHFSLSGTSDLNGWVEIEEIQGLMRIPLAQTDNLLYQQRQVAISGQARVKQGAFRIYSPVKLDFWQMAAIFVDHPEPEPPAGADLQRNGFVVHQALPDQSVSFTANLIPMADRYLLLVGSDVATGVSINYD